MARMVPDRPPVAGPGRDAERRVYEALRRTLDDDFHVYCNQRVVDPSEGESDFLIVHRTLGLLNLECKGRGVGRGTDGVWRRGSSRLEEDPFEQAQRTMHLLATALTRQVASSVPGWSGPLPFRYGYAVVFPKAVRLELNLPMDVPGHTVFDASDLGGLGDRVQEAMKRWKAARGAVRPLAPDQFGAFLKRGLHRELHFVEGLGARLHATEQTFVQLTAEQSMALHGALGNRRLSVAGGAGTGKTVLAVELARRLARNGESVLLVCFNRFLGRFLSTLAAETSVDERFEALHFHALIPRAFEALGRTMTVPEGKDAARSWWENEAPLVLMEAAAAGGPGPYDAVIIDEGQDFAPGWIEALEELLREPEKGRFVTFHDESQDLFDRGGASPFQYRLAFNLRNTRRIAAAVRSLGGVAMQSHPRSPEGEPIAVHVATKPSRVRREVEALVRRLVEREAVRPERITILSHRTRPNTSLAGVKELADLPLASDPLHREGKLLHTTIRAFKGLESDVLLLIDVDPGHERCTALDRYVAASRARQVLHVWGRDWMAGGTEEDA